MDTFIYIYIYIYLCVCVCVCVCMYVNMMYCLAALQNPTLNVTALLISDVCM